MSVETARKLAKEFWPIRHKTWEALVESGEMPSADFQRLKELAGVI